MKKKVYVCGGCNGTVNDSSRFCVHCGSQFDSVLFDDTFGIEVGDTVVDDDGNEYSVSLVEEDYWLLTTEEGEELTVQAEDFGIYTKVVEIGDATVAFSVNKGEAADIKKQVLEVDPKATFSTFVPLSKQMEGVFVKTSKEKEVETFLKENKVNVVKGKNMGYTNL